uniref:Ig-like domain-containing protein n=1 Tax=Sciurus vulgaris TaxID=55149 RepID=A0A8D2CZE3_SCIVU
MHYLSVIWFKVFESAVVSYTEVSGVVGQPVTLPCSYSVDNGAVTSMCWGRGACPISKCSDEIIWTDGTQVTFRKHMRYKLEGNLLEGDVSLTIEDAAKTDSGLYCCRIEHRGWFNDMKVTLSLEIKPDGNGTMTQSSDGLWHNNQTQVFPARSPGMTNAGLYIGIAISTLVLLLTLEVICFFLYSCYSSTLFCSMVSLTGPQIGTLQSEADVRARAEDNVYVIEDNLYVME